MLDVLKINYFMCTFKTIPFSYLWILSKAIDRGVESVLDIGCGDGDLMKILSHNEKWKIVGAELYPDAIKSAIKKNVYESIIKTTVSEIDKKIKGKKFDVVLASQVIEHLRKKDGEKALSQWEKLTAKRIIVATTVGYTPYERIGAKLKEKNPYQKHLSGWSIEEFRKRGYKVRGQGLRFIYGEKGLARNTSRHLLVFWEIISYIFSPVTYFIPEMAFIMVCTKDVGYFND